MEIETKKKVATKKPLVQDKQYALTIILTTAETEYPFIGDNLQVLLGLEPKKISGKTTIQVTRNGLTYIKSLKPVLLKKFLSNGNFLTILEKQITTLLK